MKRLTFLHFDRQPRGRNTTHRAGRFQPIWDTPVVWAALVTLAISTSVLIAWAISEYGLL